MTGGKFHTLFNSISDAIFITGMDGRFILVNSSACERLAYSQEELLQMGPADIDTPEYAAKVPERIKALQEHGKLVFESAHVRKDGVVIPIELNSRIIDYDGRPAIMAVARDITERKRAEELLRKSSEEVEDLYNHAPCGYHSLDKDGIIRRINDTELAWLGYTRDEVVGKMKWPDLVTPASLQTFRETFPQLMREGFVHDLEVEIIRKDGTVFIGLINATAIYDPRGNYVMSRSTVADITERKRVERQLRELTAHIQTVREEEKASIAREIHDDLGGMLTTLKMRTYWLKTELSVNKETIPLLDHVGEMSQLIDNAADAMRNIITGLRPSILDDLGLVAALEWQAAQFHKHTGIKCRVNCVCENSEDCGKELDKPRSIALFRISQEALTNVARHSGASRVEIEFHRNEEEIVMSIIDNGRGTTETRADAPIPYGIAGMRERADQLGGKINFGPMPGGGFNLTVILPLPVGEEVGT
ncbi:MAG: PAS domain S-box protein [Betaproteobacteria bacterium]|nr:PAS domain S-box protein [Betaproteobacteria bacterium]